MNTSSLMEQILSSDNLNRAYLQVVRNKGAEGVDGMKYTELKEHLVKNGEIIKEQLRTRRNWSVSNCYKIEKLNQLTRGWINYFGIGYMKWLCKDMDALIRRRLRMCIWVHWKTPQNRAQNLMKLGMYSKKAYAIAYSGARVARLSEGALNYVITNKRLASFGLVSMYDYYPERFVKC